MRGLAIVDVNVVDPDGMTVGSLRVTTKVDGTG
jgi:hypothetical protein